MVKHFVNISSSLAIALMLAIVIRLAGGIFYDSYGLFSYKERQAFKTRLENSVESLQKKQLVLKRILSTDNTMLQLQEAYAHGYRRTGEMFVVISGYQPAAQFLDPGQIILSRYRHVDNRSIMRAIAVFAGAIIGILFLFADMLMLVDKPGEKKTLNAKSEKRLFPSKLISQTRQALRV